MSISAQYISDFLAQNKTISLEKIGTLSLPQAATLDEEGNTIPQQQLFVYDKKAETTPAFIDYLAVQTQKSKTIVQSDFEYFLDQSRQLMNLGSTPLIISGIGYIYAKKNGEYDLSTEDLQQANDKPAIEDPYSNSLLTSRTNYASQKPNSRTIGRWALILLIIGIIAYGAYYIPKSPFKIFNTAPDTTAHAAAAATLKKPTTPNTNTVAIRKPGVYKFVFQRFTQLVDAQKRSRQLRNYGNIVQLDSTSIQGRNTYRLYVLMQEVQAADTTHIKDSLRAYYGHTVTIE